MALVVLASAPLAHAFCRETTVPIDPSFPAGQCWDQGLPVYWAKSCVGYAVQQDASKQITADQAQQLMDTAFAKWHDASCGPSISVEFLGDVACHSVEYNQAAGNANVVMFDDASWPYPASAAADTLALTHITYNIDTGELYDADLEVNTAQNQFSLDGTGTGPDLRAVLTHEAGHFLGLAHSGDPTATMYAKYVGSSMATLATDDETGICTIYAHDGTRSTADGGLAAGACDPTPRHGFASNCQNGQSSGCSCTSAPRRTDRSAVAWIALGLALAARRLRGRFA